MILLLVMIMNNQLIDYFKVYKPTKQQLPNFKCKSILKLSPTKKGRRLRDIYYRCQNQAHEEDPIGETINFSLLAKGDFELSCFEDAYTNEVWIQEMKEEMDSIHKNDTWELVDLQHEKKKFKIKWVYNIKHNCDRTIER